MDSRAGLPDGEPGGGSPSRDRLSRLLDELGRLRRAGIFTEEQFEDERRRLERDAERGGGPPTTSEP